MKDDKNRKIEKQKNREREKEKERKRETRTLFGSLRSTAVDNIIYKYLYTYIYLVIYIYHIGSRMLSQTNAQLPYSHPRPQRWPSG